MDEQLEYQQRAAQAQLGCLIIFLLAAAALWLWIWPPWGRGEEARIAGGGINAVVTLRGDRVTVHNTGYHAWTESYLILNDGGGYCAQLGHVAADQRITLPLSEFRNLLQNAPSANELDGWAGISATSDDGIIATCWGKVAGLKAK